MKFLVDENLPPRLSSWLVQQGFDVIHVRDAQLLGKPDPEISTPRLLAWIETRWVAVMEAFTRGSHTVKID